MFYWFCWARSHWSTFHICLLPLSLTMIIDIVHMCWLLTFNIQDIVFMCWLLSFKTLYICAGFSDSYLLSRSLPAASTNMLAYCYPRLDTCFCTCFLSFDGLEFVFSVSFCFLCELGCLASCLLAGVAYLLKTQCTNSKLSICFKVLLIRC